ncbi:hypothetical protein [Lignipirellula cremea]|uniref:Ser-Thr-rich glycosyl-phosphatidyl-inositol-anchored membrane family protein n=1 Tax=Lignipirellula cremea TaxID=2528010 RepID=A0A518DWY7_9BACT|nr:hypothetical protein [Lignipirellula cremea]QDU96349.1 hypothetical protein Pla8534_41690 [Lignipirellula cremea]
MRKYSFLVALATVLFCCSRSQAQLFGSRFMGGMPQAQAPSDPPPLQPSTIMPRENPAAQPGVASPPTIYTPSNPAAGYPAASQAPTAFQNPPPYGTTGGVPPANGNAAAAAPAAPARGWSFPFSAANFLPFQGQAAAAPPTAGPATPPPAAYRNPPTAANITPASGPLPGAMSGTMRSPAQTAVSANAGPQQPVVTRQTRMIIPYVNPVGAVPIEMQLFVSVDSGRTWNLQSRNRPDAGQFEFAAAGDGEYWFALHTLTEVNRAQTPATFQPELIVKIDTAAPQVDFVAESGSSGELRVRWNVVDPNLDPTLLRLEYQGVGEPNWRPVAIDPAATSQGMSQGQTAWLPQAAGQAMNVRLHAVDLAGNPTVVHRRVLLQPVNTGQAPANTNPPLLTPPSLGSAPWPAGESAPLAGSAYGTAPGATGAAMAGAVPPAIGATGAAATTWAPNHQATGTPLETNGPSASLGAEPQKFPEATSAVWGAAPSQVHPAVGSQADAARTSGLDRPPVGARAPQPPRSEGLQATRLREFNLEYDVEAVGPTGVKKVELWFTRDGGASWAHLSDDDDLKSPIHVEVDREGTYGFTIVATAGSGLAGRRPASGDAPDAWIAVDLTPPQVEIVSAPYGDGEQAGQLVIQWVARDERLADRPITLYYAERPSGPWSIIASGLANTGSYAWAVDSNSPRKVHLKVEVRDKAGHMATAVTPEVVSLEGLVPKARVRGLAEPAETTGMISNPYYLQRR